MKRYPLYRNSGVRWIGEVPYEWDTLKIKWLSPVKRGASPRPIDDPKYFNDDGEFSWVRIADVTASERYLERTTQTLSELGSSLSVKRYPGDFFISIAGTVGKPVITKIKCCIHDGFVYFPLLRINPEFLYYMFSAGELFNGLGKWGTQLNLNTETVGDIHVPRPTDLEIDAVVKYLNHKTNLIDTLIEKKQKQIELLQEQRAAIINQAVTKGLKPNVKMKDSGIDWLGEVPEHWQLIKLKHLVAMKSGDGITSDSIDESGDYPVYGGNGLRGFTSSFTHDGNFVLIGRQGALCGNVHLVKDKFWASEHAVVVTQKTGHDVIWLAELLRMMNLNQYSESAAQPGISVEKIQNLYIPVPYENESKEIATYLDKRLIKQQIAIETTNKEIVLLTEYRTTLISEVVTGKIDVRDEVIP